MASQSLQQSDRAKNIRDLFGEFLASEVISKLCGSDPEPLTPEEVGRLEETEQAGSNALSAARMGLQVVGDYLYHAQENPGEAMLNEASALLELLTEVVYQADDASGGASRFLAMHYKALAARNEAQAKPAKRGGK
jgi:hypothetical protein